MRQIIVTWSTFAYDSFYVDILNFLRVKNMSIPYHLKISERSLIFIKYV